MMDERVKAFERMLVGTFDEHCDSILYTLKCHLLYHVVENLTKFETLPVFDSSRFEHFNVYIKYSYRKTSRRRQILMVETVNVLQRCYKKALQYEEKGIDVNLGRIWKIYARAEQNGPYLVRDGITITMDDLFRAVSDSEKTLSGTSVAIDLVYLFRESTMQSFMARVHEIAEEYEAKVPDNKVRLAFVKSGDMLGGYIPTLIDVDFDKGCIGEPGEYTRTLQQAFANERFGAAGERSNSFVLVSSGIGEENGPWVAKVLFLFQVSVRGDSESREDACLPYVEVTRPIDTVDEALGCACIRWITDHEVYQNLVRCTVVLDREHLSTVQRFRMEIIQTLQGCVNVLRANHAIEPFTKRIPRPLRRLYLNWF